MCFKAFQVLVFVLVVLLREGVAHAQPFAYISHSGGVSIINVLTNTLVDTVKLSGEAFYSGIAVSPSGSHVYVSAFELGTVFAIDTSDNSVIAIDVPSPGDLAVSPDGSRVYVTNIFKNSLSIIDTSQNKVISTVTEGLIRPDSVTVTPDGSRIYVTMPTINAVAIIDTSNNTLIGTVAVGPLADDPAGPTANPLGITVAQAGEATKSGPC
jgi:YVTN family beta-propeller protein